MLPQQCFTRREFTGITIGTALSLLDARAPLIVADEPSGSTPLRGLVVVPSNLTLPDWPKHAQRAGLNALTLHHAESPRTLSQFLIGDQGREYLQQCRDAEIDMEFDFHAMTDLVPRGLFSKAHSMFRMDQNGERNPDRNFCVHSQAALDLAAENAVAFAATFPTTTNRYYYWSDGCAGWCRCPECRELSDSDQSLVVENALVAALRQARPGAQVAHLACHSSMPAPTKVSPADGVFLQFAPGRRRYDIPLSEQRSEDQVDSLWFLERNLQVFPVRSAQILEYWLDVTNFGVGAGPLPWNRARFLGDLATYRSFGLQHFKCFANGLDAEYVRKFEEPAFVNEYGAGLKADS